MSIVRAYHNRENPYVQLNKKALWDPALSLEAVGLWARLMSRPDDWHVMVPELAKSCGCGEKKIYRLLNELIKANYARRLQPRHENEMGNVVFGKWETYVFEFKLENEEDFKKCLSHGHFEQAIKRPSDVFRDFPLVVPVAEETRASHISSGTGLGEELKKEDTESCARRAARESSCELLLSKIKERKPNFSKTITPTWRRDMDRLLKLRTREQVVALINWCAADEFWGGIVQAPSGLLKNLDQIEARISRPLTAADRKKANKQFVEALKKKYSHRDDVQFSNDYMAVIQGTHFMSFTFDDPELRQKVLHRLRFIDGISTEGL